jgi:hypothetical protein
MASRMGAPNRREQRAYYARFLMNPVLGIMLAFPLGIITASIQAVSLFGTILPISILFAIILPIIIPLVVISGVGLASWHLAAFVIRPLNSALKTVVALARNITFLPEAVHIFSHAHEIAYMGIYGTLVMFSINPHPTEPEKTGASPSSSFRRQSRTPLFIQDFPISRIPVLPLTPPYSDSSYPPSRNSPTCTESTDMSFSLDTPIDEHAHKSVARLSELLGSLKDEELSNVANYVEILKRRRSSSSLG